MFLSMDILFGQWIRPFAMDLVYISFTYYTEDIQECSRLCIWLFLRRREGTTCLFLGGSNLGLLFQNDD